jgi:sugar phosphate isomerase/epimerase
VNRRSFLGVAAAAVAGGRAVAAESFRLRYALASSLYGTAPLAEILPEVARTGSECLDIWPRIHANQREQMDEMGHDTFAALLEKHQVRVGVFTRYDLGLARIRSEFDVAKRFGAEILISASGGPKNLTGPDLKAAVAKFAESLKPLAADAETFGVTIGIENHANALIDSPDSLRWFAEMCPSDRLGIALAPYHLPQDPAAIASLITDCGQRIVHFYAWEHGKGSHTKMPKADELLQMPGRGTLDFVPILAALKRIRFRGLTQVFMHPFPRGLPILDTTAAVTAEVNRARDYLRQCLERV